MVYHKFFHSLDRKQYIGIDIGGTKTAVMLIDIDGNISDRMQFSTLTGKGGWQKSIKVMKEQVARLTKQAKVESIGVSCGGPLNSRKGIILSPPNLPGWDQVPITDIFSEAFGIPTYLENDANAGALAEWLYGAGKGYNNVIFLTFGTGLGAGLILNGKLYNGTNDYGGEAGHIRLAPEGPIGYHKRGSFEGFCSGTGLAQMMSVELMFLAEEEGRKAVSERYKVPGDVTGKDVVEWAKKGDPLALQVVEKSGRYLGMGLSILIDILNPEVIVIGSMGVRLGNLLFDPAREVINKEALPGAAAVCKIVPAKLGEKIGDYAALCVAIEGARRG